jgi:F0F1-type ATP synthase membrane subunit c/vacuolar-type H+-ATPase subunit K
VNTTATMARPAEMSPKTRARLIGALLLVTMVGGGFAQGYVAGRIVSGDAAATAANIVTHQQLYRLGFAVYLVEMACQIAMTVLTYQLLKPAGKTASALALAFGLIGCTIKTMARLFFFAPLLVLGGVHYLSVFDPKQLEALAFFSLRMNYTVETIAMVFFGFNTLLTGYLILRSSFLPRALGVLSVVGGLGWLLYLYEPLAHRLESGIVGVGVIGALVMVVWFLVMGVDEQRWREQARIAVPFA